MTDINNLIMSYVKNVNSKSKYLNEIQIPKIISDFLNHEPIKPGLFTGYSLVVNRYKKFFEHTSGVCKDILKIKDAIFQTMDFLNEFVNDREKAKLAERNFVTFQNTVKSYNINVNFSPKEGDPKKYINDPTQIVFWKVNLNIVNPNSTVDPKTIHIFNQTSVIQPKGGKNTLNKSTKVQKSTKPKKPPAKPKKSTK